MGKAKKLAHLKQMRNVPLSQQIDDDRVVRQRDRQRAADEDENDNDNDRQNYIDPKLSQKILSSARKQQSELEDEFGLGSSSGPKPRKQTKLSDRADSEASDESDAEGHDNEDYNETIKSFYDELKVNIDDEKALELFMNRDSVKRKTLADIIAEKIKEKETEIQTQLSDATGVRVQDMDEKVVDLYKGVKVVLSRYRSGKLPKAFKIIPALANWEQVLHITDPDNWTAASMYAATRLFTSNLKDRMAQRFFNLILLPRIRDDIGEYKRLNFHLYQALRKSLFKSAAFFKGIVLPLCESGDCTLREAMIVSSVMAKHHIPLLHSCAAMLKIAEMDYSGANSVFLHTLIRKNYSLPYRVVDGLVYHFLRFANDKRELPILWHQCLLVFVQNYKQDLSSEQKEAILELLRVKSHYQITPEIRKELLNSKTRDQEVAASVDGSDHMSNTESMDAFN